MTKSQSHPMHDVFTTVLEKPPRWVAGDGPDASTVVISGISLVRNLSDFPFSHQCSGEEKTVIEGRVRAALVSLDLLTSGRYYCLSELEPGQARCMGSILAERWLATFGFSRQEGPRGIYLDHGQAFSIMVNGVDHVCLRSVSSGLQLAEDWSRMNSLDNALSAVLDFAFNDRFGYLTPAVAHIGTGLKVSVILHLPGLVMTNGLVELERFVREQRHVFEGLMMVMEMPAASVLAVKGGAEARVAGRSRFPAMSLFTDSGSAWQGDLSKAQGDLFQVSNRSTLGCSEDEIVFNLTQIVGQIIEREKHARETLEREGPRRVEDRVWRALGLARSARLLEFDECLRLISALRLGVAAGLIDGYSIRDLNSLMLASQSAHLGLKSAQVFDEFTLSMERANLFRARLS